MTTDERLVRLVSDGEEMSGGGLPLPDAFSAALQQLADNGTTSYSLLSGKITGATLIQMKRERILAIWGSWEAFAEDIIVTLDKKRLIRASDARGVYWDLGSAFTEGESLEVISPEEVKEVTGGIAGSPVTVTVFGSGARSKRNEMANAMIAVNKCRAEIARLGMMTTEIGNHFFQVEGLLDGRKDARPPQPEDEPDRIVTCAGPCGRQLARTRVNFFFYWSRDQWYWRPRCRDCMMPAKNRLYQERLIKIVNQVLAENGGKFPPGESAPKLVADRMMQEVGGETGSVHQSWDRLTKRGLLPPRP